jgi:hypothetical protein
MVDILKAKGPSSVQEEPSKSETKKASSWFVDRIQKIMQQEVRV